MSKAIDELSTPYQNDLIRNAIITSIKDQFPVVGKHHTLKLDLLHLDLSKVDELDLPAQKEAKLAGKAWTAPLLGSFSLIDNNTGQIIDKTTKMRIGNIPQLTNRFSTVLKKGTEYQTVNQLRLKSGVYTRQQATGEFESRFNLEKGFNFRLWMDPDKGIFLLNLGNQNYKLYLILHALGVSDSVLIKAWGEKIFSSNAKQGTHGMEASIINLFEKLMHEKTDYSTALNGLKTYLKETKVSSETTKITLGQSFSTVSTDTLIATSEKLLKVMKGEEPPDERDSLLFKKLFPLDDLIKNYMTMTMPKIKSNLQYRADSKNKVRDILSSETFTDPILLFFNKSELTSSPPQTNPVEMLGEWRKTTLMGEGGIRSVHAITNEVRDIHESQMGFLDPINTPESSRIGVTLPITIGTTRSKGEMYTDLIKSDGKSITVSPTNFHEMFVGLPDQFSYKNLIPVPHGSKVKAIHKGKISEVSTNKIDAWIPSPAHMFSWTTNLIPFLANNEGARAMMGTKMLPQALPLKNPDSPFIQTKVFGTQSFEKAIGEFVNPRATQTGIVKSVTEDYVTIDIPGQPKPRKIGLFNNFPLNQGTYLHSTPIVVVGDKVKTGDTLAVNNYQKDGLLALGANVNVAYMPWKGYNFEDSAVVTESLAEKFTSVAIVRERISTSPQGVLSKKVFRVAFPDILLHGLEDKLDDSGIIKVGETVNPNDVLIAYMERRDLTDEEKILKQMNKVMSSPYINRSLVWSHETSGKILYVNKIGKQIMVHIKTETPMVVGDKVAGRHGNKMIVSKIIPDDEAPHTLTGKRIDLMINPHGVPGRMNIGQLLETAYGKISDKTKQSVRIENFSNEDHLDKLKKEFKKYNLHFNEVLLDGKDGKPFENPIFTGNQYMMKLKQVVEHKLKARDYGSYTVDQQPGKGEKGGQKMDPLTTYVMLAHGAKENLREASIIKGQKNDEIWRALQLGLPLPPPKVNFAFDKLLTYLKSAGVDTRKDGHTLTLTPFLDSDVKNISSGKLSDPGHMLVGKNLTSIKGGLFDEDITGGKSGKKWSHIKLEEKMPHPIYESAIISILKYTKPQFEKTLDSPDGNKEIEKALSQINIDDEIKKSTKELLGVPDVKVNSINKRIRFLQALKKNNLKPTDYMIQYFPIMPPLFRPVYPLPDGTLVTSPINAHYRDLGEINDALKTYKNLGPEVYKEFSTKTKKDLYRTLKETVGLIDVTRPGMANKYEGLIKTLVGTTPKAGFVQNKAWAKRQDFSARSTITLEPSLGLDEVGIPYDMAKILYKPFIVQELVKQGLPAIRALDEIKAESLIARTALIQAMNKRPILLNRAPSLHKHGVQAFKPILMVGKSIRINPLVVSGFNADFDGDTMSVHLPITTKAVDEANNMVPSKNVFGAGSKLNIPVKSFSQDYMLGLWHLTRDQADSKKKFNSIAEAKGAGLKIAETFELAGIGKTTLGRIAVNEMLPQKYRNYSRIMTHKALTILMTLIAQESPTDYATIIDSLKDLGNQYGHRYGATVSLTDVDVDKTFKEKAIKFGKKKEKSSWNKNERADYWQKMTEQINQKTFDSLANKNNSLMHMLDSGSIGKKGNIAQILSMGGVKTDIRNEPLERPFVKSWTEGQDMADYWEGLYSSRKGIVDRTINTADSGALNKALLGAIRDVLITDDDCETTEGIKLSIDDPDIVDRFLLHAIPGVGAKNELATQASIAKAKLKNIKEIEVRSPLTCREDYGICQLCYGLMSNGKIPPLGTNVGILDGQAVTERSTQLTMQTFHTGGARGTGIMEKFPRLEQLLKVPKIVKGKAILASKSGIVESIDKSPIGGWDVVINGTHHRVPLNLNLVVKKGQKITVGDQISEGVIKPQELATLKDFRSAQLQMVKDFDNVYNGDFHKRTFETVVRGISNNAEITLAPASTGFLRGDLDKISRINSINEDRVKNKLPLIEYRPYFRSISMLPSDQQDWLSRLTTERLKQTITEGAASGMATNIKGRDPLPAYIYGLEFAKDFDPKRGQFY